MMRRPQPPSDTDLPGDTWETQGGFEPAGDGVQGEERSQAKGIEMNSTLLWIIAAILVVVGIVQLAQGQIFLGVALIVVGCIVGPGGYSIFKNRRN